MRLTVIDCLLQFPILINGRRDDFHRKMQLLSKNTVAGKLCRFVVYFHIIDARMKHSTESLILSKDNNVEQTLVSNDVVCIPMRSRRDSKLICLFGPYTCVFAMVLRMVLTEKIKQKLLNFSRRIVVCPLMSRKEKKVN